MKLREKLVGGLFLFVMLFGGFGIAEASVWVNGYFKSNGTYVSGHYRSSPDNSIYNNWSYPGNTNPYTGVTAGGSVDSYLDSYGSYNYSYDYPSYADYSNYTYDSYYNSNYNSYDYESLYDIYYDAGYYGW